MNNVENLRRKKRDFMNTDSFSEISVQSNFRRKRIIEEKLILEEKTKANFGSISNI